MESIELTKNRDRHDPYSFVLAILESFPDLVADAAATHRISHKHPAKTRDEYLAELDEQGLIKVAVALRELATR